MEPAHRPQAEPGTIGSAITIASAHEHLERCRQRYGHTTIPGQPGPERRWHRSSGSEKQRNRKPTQRLLSHGFAESPCMMQGLGAWPPPLASSRLRPATTDALISGQKPHPARVCAAGAGWAVLVGSMRVPTAEQNLALQHNALLAAGIAPERIYDDTCPGAVTNRPGTCPRPSVRRFSPGSIL